MMARTIPIANDPDFRALEAYANAILTAKGYGPLARKGSTSWIDPRIKPADAAVRFKLMMYEDGIFFGAREEWADDLSISHAAIGSDSRAPMPSPVEFRGDFIRNDAAGRRKIDTITGLFP